MTEAMPFLRKLILLSYDPRPSARGLLLYHYIINISPIDPAKMEGCPAGLRK